MVERFIYQSGLPPQMIKPYSSKEIDKIMESYGFVILSLLKNNILNVVGAIGVKEEALKIGARTDIYNHYEKVGTIMQAKKFCGYAGKMSEFLKRSYRSLEWCIEGPHLSLVGLLGILKEMESKVENELGCLVGDPKIDDDFSDELSFLSMTGPLICMGLAHHVIDGIPGDPAYPHIFAAMHSFHVRDLAFKSPMTHQGLINPPPQYAGIDRTYLFLENVVYNHVRDRGKTPPEPLRIGDS